MIQRLKSSPAFRNAVASYFAFLSTALWGLLSIPIAVAYLDKSEIGLWAVVNTIIGYLVWMDLGIGAATGRLIADAVAANDHTEIDCWWSATRFILWIQGSLVILLGSCLAPLAIHWSDLSGTQASDALFLLIGGSVIIGLSFTVRGTTGLLTAQNRFHWIPLMQGTVPWLNLAAFYLCLRSGWGLRSYIVGLAASHATIWILCRCFVAFGPYKPVWNRKGISRTRIKALFNLSGNMTIVGLIDSILQGLPNILLARLGGLASVPIYNFSSRGPMLSSGLVSRTYQSFYPSLLRLHVTGNKQAFKDRHLAIGRVTLSVALCGAACVLALNPLIVQLLAGNEFFAGSMVNSWFAVALITIPLAGLFQSLLPISGSMGKAAPVSFIKLILGALAAVSLWPLFGMAGLAAVFALLPIVDLIYAYYRGTQGCGFPKHGLSPQLLPHALIALALTLTAGFLSKNQPASGEAFYIIGRKLYLPTLHDIALPALLLLAGIGCLAVFTKKLFQTS
jgi:O-antigen/teichoic acid export membrane protein